MTGWRDQAACAGVELAVFYPNTRTGITTAKAFCARCPVQTDCLTDCLTIERNQPAELRFGIVGGLTPLERWQGTTRTPQTCALDGCDVTFTPVNGQKFCCPQHRNVDHCRRWYARNRGRRMKATA